MWTNQEGYTFIIPARRVRWIMRRLWDSGFQDLARSSYQGSWRRTLRRVLGRVLGQSTRAAGIRCGNGSVLPVFRSEIDGTIYHFVTVQRRNGNFSILAVRTRERSEDERFDSRETQRALTHIDQHLVPDATSLETVKRLILENTHQADVHGNSVQPVRGKRNLPDRSYIAMINGELRRVNVEVDTDRQQQKRHMRVVNRRDPNAHNFFISIDSEGRPNQVFVRRPGQRMRELLRQGSGFGFLPALAAIVRQRGQDPWWNRHSQTATKTTAAARATRAGRKVREFEHEMLFENELEHEFALV
jgi:hypothetical protein